MPAIVPPNQSPSAQCPVPSAIPTVAPRPLPIAALDHYLASEPAHPAPGLAPLAAWRLREQNQPVPDHLIEIERRSAYGAVTAPWLLERVRAAVTGPIILLKGPEIAARYPSPALRPYGDLDLLVENLSAAEEQLLAAGFTRLSSENAILPGYIHDLPFRFESTALAIEIHRRPGWLDWMNAPSNAEIVATAVPSVTGVPGLLTLPPLEHTLYLAVHSWRHGPFHSLLHLIDIDLLRRESDPAELEEKARAWGIERLWSSTLRLIDYLLYEKTTPPLTPLQRLWSRHLREHRPRTLREYYLATRTSGLAASTPRKQASAVTHDLLRSFALRPGETPRSLARYTLRNLTTKNAPAHTSPRRH